MTSGRQMGDTQGAVPDYNNSPFALTSPLALQTMSCIDLALRMHLASNSVMDITRKNCEILYQALPLVCLPSVYLMLLQLKFTRGYLN